MSIFNREFKKKTDAFFFRLRCAVFGSYCVVCGEVTDSDSPLCREHMQEYLYAREFSCGQCGERLDACTCSNDVLRRVGVRRMLKLLRYFPGEMDSTVSQMLFHLKYQHIELVERIFAKDLARAFMEFCKPDETWIITYAPRTPMQRSRYKYDQAQELAIEISRITGIPCVKTLRRPVLTKVQKKLRTREERLRNVTGSYKLVKNADIQGKRILLVDDIITTGASLAECTRVLRREGGARHITAAAVAIVPHNLPSVPYHTRYHM